MTQLLARILAIALFVGPGIYMAYLFLSKRYIKGTRDKTFAYLCAEYSYYPERSTRLIETVKSEAPGRIWVPIVVTWAGITSPIFNKFATFWLLLIMSLYLLLVAFFGLALLNRYFPIGNTNLDLLDLLFLLTFLGFFFVCYFRSVASDLCILEEKSEIAMTLFKEAGWLNIDIDVLDTVYKQVKIDLDLYKSNVGLGGLVIILLTTFVSFRGKELGFIPPFFVLPLLLVTPVVMGFRWMYESYRTRILHIAANALLEIKKHKLILATQEVPKVIETGGRAKTNTRVTNRKVTLNGDTRCQCQIGFP
jgi:hypothetical protein